MKSLAQNKTMSYTRLPKLNLSHVPKLIFGALALVASFYLVAGVGMIIYTSKNSPKVQAAIAEFDDGPLKTVIDFIL